MDDLKFQVFAAAFIVFLLSALLGSKRKREASRNREKAVTKRPLTEREISMFYMLNDAFTPPNFVVLSQVSLSALLCARSTACRETFDRMVSDFVICDRSFKVLAIIELADPNRIGRDKENADRRKLLTDAGYSVLRYRQVPDVGILRDDLRQI